jgi:hypothetical protein
MATLMSKKKVDLSVCPMPLQDNTLNVKNHMEGIKMKGLGPADPRVPNDVFWADKAEKWGVTPGDARGRLCCNCRFFVNSSDIKACIENGPAKDLKASALPLNPRWADIESKPVAFCVLLDITCSPVRTCDFQQLGGPIDDDKRTLPKYRNILAEEKNEKD